MALNLKLRTLLGNLIELKKYELKGVLKMAKKKLCFGNWKMNKTPEEAKAFLTDFSKEISPSESDHFALFPGPVLSGVFSMSAPSLDWGGQNCYFKNEGAFTGETSPKVLKSMGAKYCLIGHSERRHIFKEVDADLNEKTKACLAEGLTPVFCIGETEGEFDKKITMDVLKKQIDLGLKEVDLTSIILAYEPVWAIGTGKAATPEIVQEVHTQIRKLVHLETPLLYGGSVKPQNAKELYNIKDVDGFLIGGASLTVDSFCRIFKEMEA